jgi:hypothetical protein
MPTIPEPQVGERSLAAIRTNVPPPIDEAWKDETVETLMRELRRQLRQIENCPPTPDANEASIRNANVQTLVKIERTLTHLFDVHEQRALRHDKEAAASHDDALHKLEERVDRLIAAADAQALEKKSDGVDGSGSEASA